MLPAARAAKGSAAIGRNGNTAAMWLGVNGMPQT
jgi:hypothetical protein